MLNAKDGNALELAQAIAVHEIFHAIQFEHFVLGRDNSQIVEIAETRGVVLWCLEDHDAGILPTRFRILNDLAATLIQQDDLADQCGWSRQNSKLTRSIEECGIPQSVLKSLGFSNSEFSVSVR